MRTQIESHIEFNGLVVKFEKFLQIWADGAGRDLKVLPFKRDLTGWNNGPTSMHPKKVIACYQWSKHEGDVCLGIYEIWERQDGLGTKVYKFDTIDEYNDYNPSQESPLAIKKEIGLCVNYHLGK